MQEKELRSLYFSNRTVSLDAPYDESKYEVYESNEGLIEVLKSLELSEYLKTIIRIFKLKYPNVLMLEDLLGEFDLEEVGDRVFSKSKIIYRDENDIESIVFEGMEMEHDGYEPHIDYKFSVVFRDPIANMKSLILEELGDIESIESGNILEVKNSPIESINIEDFNLTINLNKEYFIDY